MASCRRMVADDRAFGPQPESFHPRPWTARVDRSTLWPRALVGRRLLTAPVRFVQTFIKARGLNAIVQSIIIAMAHVPLPFTALPWDAAQAQALANASAAIARLDARVCASPVSAAWKLRASSTGYSAALQLQQSPLEEIDIIAERCGLRLPARPVPRTEDEPFAAYTPWLARLHQPDGRHWTEDLPFTFDAPAGWREAPTLIQALTLLDLSARTDRTSAPWLAFPSLLRRMGLTQAALPCMVAGDAAQRSLRDARPALLKRLLKQLSRAAEAGLERLDRLEAYMRRAATVIAGEHRAGKLADLARIALARPCLAARSAAPLLDITISGAGKLLERATALGLMDEISGRGSWRTYVTPDIAVALGVRTAERGRPANARPGVAEAADILHAFELEMAEIDARLERLGIGVKDEDEGLALFPSSKSQ